MLTLPPCSFPSNYMENRLRLGFDPKTNDYKVFNLTSYENGYNIVLQAEVYSMRKGSWESISQTIPSHIIRHRGQNTFLINENHGHIHWLCDTHTDIKSKRRTIVAFDLSEETFSEIPFPDSIPDYIVNRTNVLGVLKGKLCVISCVKDGECEVWVMAEYGIGESWAKHHGFYKLSGDIFPYGFTSHNELLFKVGKYDNEFALYDPFEAKTKTCKMKGGYVVAKVVDLSSARVLLLPVAIISTGLLLNGHKKTTPESLPEDIDMAASDSDPETDSGSKSESEGNEDIRLSEPSNTERGIQNTGLVERKA
ncbi:hypothetical protein LXL04_030756 [Taraxacum kok-saghyz]